MSNIFVFCWVPGSCGDIVQHMASRSQQIYTGFDFAIDSQGRAYRKIQKEFAELFPHNQLHLVNASATDHGWLLRDWNDKDCDALQKLSQSRSVMIGTHSSSQVIKLKEYLGSTVTTVGMVYDSLLHKFVVKNYCQKILNQDAVSKSYFKNTDPKLFRMLENNHAVGIWSLKNELESQQQVPNTVLPNFDINIDLGKFLCGDLQWATEFDAAYDVYQQWAQLQNPLFRFDMPNNVHWNQCLGRNCSAVDQTSDPIEFDLYDKIIVNFYCKKHKLPNPRVNNHLELHEFFEKQPSIITTAQENSTAQYDMVLSRHPS